MNVNPKLAAGMKAVADGVSGFAHTQGLWRFLRNERVSQKDLSEPVLAFAQSEVDAACEAYALSIHDWSRLNYYRHKSKKDRAQLTHKTDVGYELQSTLLVCDRDGLPIGVPTQNLVCEQGSLQSRCNGMQETEAHLDELTRRMEWLESQPFGKPLVHIIDREGDSAAHLRQWKNYNWIVRVKGGNGLKYEGKQQKAKAIAEGLTYRKERGVLYKGKRAIQWVGEASVKLVRKTQPKGLDAQGKRLRPVAGECLPVRLVVSRICNDQGAVLAEWFLLTNLPAKVADERIALWYYYRWSIESFFKLLKEAGHQLESWQQETAHAIAKRLLIAAQACALVWKLMRQDGATAAEARTFLVRLSGRQMKRSRPVTPTALMDGFFSFLNMLEILQQHSLDDLQLIAKTVFPHREWSFV